MLALLLRDRLQACSTFIRHWRTHLGARYLIALSGGKGSVSISASLRPCTEKITSASVAALQMSYGGMGSAWPQDET